MKNKKLSSAIILSLIIINFWLAGLSSADTSSQVINGFKQTGDAAGYSTTQEGAPKKEFVVAFSAYVTGMVTIMGAYFMILIIYAGWLWLTAQGKEEQVEKAKRMIINSLIGLAIVISGRIITEFVLNYLGKTLPGNP
ncbi:MAG: hypothetical protein PHW95_01940 [Patescibacteria group bacterium]|nr:hypothetical protein [Patescibacteria group bacterium]